MPLISFVCLHQESRPRFLWFAREIFPRGKSFCELAELSHFNASLRKMESASFIYVVMEIVNDCEYVVESVFFFTDLWNSSHAS